MKLLLDTQLLLWAAGQPERLPLPARRMIKDARSELVFSAVSIWELVIKPGLGRSDFRANARLLRRGLLANGYDELAIAANLKFPTLAALVEAVAAIGGGVNGAIIDREPLRVVAGVTRSVRLGELRRQRRCEAGHCKWPFVSTHRHSLDRGFDPGNC